MGTKPADLHECAVTCDNGSAGEEFKSRHSPHADLRVSNSRSERVRETYTNRAAAAQSDGGAATVDTSAEQTARRGRNLTRGGLRIFGILFALLAVLGVVAPSTREAAVAAPVQAARCASPAPTTAAGYAALWASLPASEWGGGDVSISVGLEDGRRVWLYGDTFSTGRMVHSSAVVQDGGCLHVSHAGAQLLPDASAGVVYWIESAEAVDGGVLVHAEETRIGRGGPWDFAYTGFMRSALASVDAAGDVTFERWVSRVRAPKADPGALIDLPGPAFGYSVRTHDVTLASGERLVTMARNYDDGKLRAPSAYAPLWFDGMGGVPK